jgi:formylglycine-generating enzyme required for sulfatase activity
VWVTVEPGSFDMGSPAGEAGRFDNETRHRVTLTRAFAMLSTEVTQTQFEVRMGYNPSRFAACGPSCPVESLNWHEAAGWAACYACTGEGPGVLCEPSRSFPSPGD